MSSIPILRTRNESPTPGLRSWAIVMMAGRGDRDRAGDCLAKTKPCCQLHYPATGGPGAIWTRSPAPSLLYSGEDSPPRRWRGRVQVRLWKTVRMILEMADGRFSGGWMRASEMASRAIGQSSLRESIPPTRRYVRGDGSSSRNSGGGAQSPHIWLLLSSFLILKVRILRLSSG